MKIAVVQINTTIGDFEGNAAKILDRMRWAEGQGAELAVFPELAVCGYPPRDLLEEPGFVRRNREAVERIAKASGRMASVIGFVSANEKREGRGLFNSAGLLRDGRIALVQHKTLLPEYDVFDEARHFEPAHEYGAVKHGGERIGLSMCEDIWSFFDFGGRKLYRTDPIAKVVEAGATVVINISASPFTLGKQEIRRNLVCGVAERIGRPVIYCNLVGGNDELVFDGRSFIADGEGKLLREAAAFEEDAFVVDLKAGPTLAVPAPRMADEEEVLAALSLGLSDYMRKCGFKMVVMGLSGGIDSALVAAIAARAIGRDKVTGVLMPSPYSSKGSVSDALALAKNLGIVTCTIPISDIYSSYRAALGLGASNDVTLAEENIQARIRGTILMAISNREGALVLSTGNKSEMSVGYCTLYGDMAGGLALISDIPKTMVYTLARHIDRVGEVIPRAIIEKAPSAELKPNQTDQESLPPYEILDPIIRAYVEDRRSAGEIVGLGFDGATVERVIGMIRRNEYKRRQAPPGIKVTSKAFGLGRRLPIARKP